MTSGLTLSLINRDETQLKKNVAPSQASQVSSQGAFQQQNTTREKNATMGGKQQETMFIHNILILAICTVQNKYSSGRPAQLVIYNVEAQKSIAVIPVWGSPLENRGQMWPHLSTEWSSVINLTQAVAVKVIILL